MATAPAEGEGHDDGGELRSTVGKRPKKVGTLRSHDPTLGLGMAMVRLQALSSPPSVASVLESDVGPLVPLRPSWWPEEIGREKEDE